MISNTKQIRIADNAYLDVTCEEMSVNGKRQTRLYGQVARGQAFGTWGSAPWEQAEPTESEILDEVSKALRATVAVVAREIDGDSIGSPIFFFEKVAQDVIPMPEPPVRLRRIELMLDPEDFDTIQTEILLRQTREQWDDEEGGPVLPEGDSNLPGAILAEVVRDLDEYRALYEGGNSADPEGAKADA